MIVHLKEGEHLRIAHQKDNGTFLIYAGAGFIHVTANSPGQPEEVHCATPATLRPVTDTPV